MMKFILNFYLCISLLSIDLLIASECFAQPISSPVTISTPTFQPSKNAASVKTAQYLLQTATLLYEQKNIVAAKNILNTIDTSSLTPELEQIYALQQATLAVASNDSNAATVWLNEDILTEIPIHDQKKQIIFYELRAKTFFLKKQFLKCVEEYEKLIKVVKKTNQLPYVDSLWDALSKIDAETLNKERLKAPTADIYNWIELELIIKDASLNEDDKKNMIRKWFLTHPNHPIPSELSAIISVN